MCMYYPGQHNQYLEEQARRNRHVLDLCPERTPLAERLRQAGEQIGAGARRLREAGARAAASVAALL